MSWDEIEALVGRAQMGDREAFGQLVERFERAVYAMAIERVRQPVEAQELTQEVFIHAMRKLPQLRDARCFAGWLRQITVRMAINRLTRNGPSVGSDPEMLEAVAGRERGPLEEIERTEARRQIHDGLSQLKPLDREALEAFYIRGRTLKQMSRELATPIGTIKRRLHVARLRLKDVLDESENRSGSRTGGLIENRAERPRKARRMSLAGV